MSLNFKFKKSSEENTKTDDEIVSEIIGAVEEQGSAVTELQAAVQEAAQVINALESEVAELKAQKAQNPEDENTTEIKAARKSMDMALKSTGGEIIKGGKLRTKSDGFGSAGDVVVTQFSNQITETILKTSALVQFFGSETGILDYKKKIAKGGTVASWDGEYVSSTPALVDVAATGGKLTASPMVEMSVAADAFFDAFAFLESDSMKRIAAQSAVALLQGDGVKKPRGLVRHFDQVEGLLPVETRDVEVFGSVVATVADETLIDTLRNAVNAVPNAYHGNARWGMSSAAFTTVYNLKDSTGRSYLQPDPQNAMGFLLHGFPVVLDVTLESTAPIMFGDFDAGFKVLNVPQAIDLVANQYRIPGFMVYDITYRAASIMGANDAIYGVFLPAA